MSSQHDTEVVSAITELANFARSIGGLSRGVADLVRKHVGDLSQAERNELLIATTTCQAVHTRLQAALDRLEQQGRSE